MHHKTKSLESKTYGTQPAREILDVQIWFELLSGGENEEQYLYALDH
jgi:hypothetical protein